MQLNNALDTLDKKEKTIEELYYPQKSFRPTVEGISCMSQVSTCQSRESPRSSHTDKGYEFEID